jgi:hypothetical protein
MPIADETAPHLPTVPVCIQHRIMLFLPQATALRLAHIKACNGFSYFPRSLPFLLLMHFNNFALKLASLVGLATFASAQSCPEALRFGSFQVSPSTLAPGDVRKHIIRLRIPAC